MIAIDRNAGHFHWCSRDGVCSHVCNDYITTLSFSRLEIGLQSGTCSQDVWFREGLMSLVSQYISH